MMMMKSVFVLACILAVGFAWQDVPSLPQAFSAHMSTKVLLSNGQQKSEAGPNYFDLSGNRTRMDVEGQGLTIISLYNVGKEFGISSGSCQYCPLQGGLGAFGPDPTKAQSIGHAEVDGVKCMQYQQNMTVLGMVMEVDTWSLSAGDNVPVQEFQLLTPFGKNAGNATTDITNFKAGAQPDSLFKVNNMDQCQKSPNCGNSYTRLVAQAFGIPPFTPLYNFLVEQMEGPSAISTPGPVLPGQ